MAGAGLRAGGDAVVSRSRVAATALGSKPIAAGARLVTPGRLRVLAYHDVEDALPFRAQMEHLVERYRPVSGGQVARAIGDARGLPPSSVWVTFDDAHPGVIERGLPVLADLGIPATLFVCPGVVDTDEPYWWQVLDSALERGEAVTVDGVEQRDRGVVTELKRRPDDERRRVVADMRERLGADSTSVRQVTSDQLHRWLDAGMEVGNHTWDHPCLDTCDEGQQERQVRMAHEWLCDLTGTPSRLFAYPNGNLAGVARRTLDALGYDIRALFDHRLASVSDGDVSRLRIDATAPLPRFAAICSGAHPLAFGSAQAARRLLRGRTTRR
jgi:peptidoglycan/xylan/chitin deacetylase (PgdA/CDA1 family)